MSVDEQLKQPEQNQMAAQPAKIPLRQKSSLDARLTVGLRYLLDKQIHFVIIGLAVAYLAFSWFSVQAKYAQLQSSDYNSSLTMSKAGATVNFLRDSASQRPAITSSTGDNLLNFNDLDSQLTINGETFKLWDTDHSYQSDATNAKFYHAIQQAKWTLFQEMSVGPEPNHVLIEYYFRNDGGISDLTLQLSHNHNYFGAAQVSTTGFKSVLSSNQFTTPDEQLQNPRYNLEMKINTAAFGNTAPLIKVEEGKLEKGALQNVLVSYSLREIPVNRRTLVASEEISWQAAPSEGK